MKSTHWITAIIASGALVGLGIAAGSAISANRTPATNAAAWKAPMTSVAAPGVGGMEELRGLNQTFTELSDSVASSVVEIRGKEQGMGGGSGSGFIYRADGWIITNDHVTGGADKVTVVLHDGKEYEGTVYSAKDDQIDVAVVKIDAKDLTPLPVADSDQVKSGQFAVAVGSPFGYESTVTIGHISAVNRPGRVFDMRTRSERVYNGMIQTDAAINPGNSGGPLINIEGEVIGVNSTISSTTGGSNGIGFAMPANTVKAVADELIANKKFDRGLLGIQFNVDLKPYRLKELGITGGALVSDAPEGGPAYKAGLRDEDIILKVDNTEIRNQNDLLLSMYRRSPGDTVEVSYLRGSQKKTTKVKLTDMKAMPSLQPQAPRGGAPEGTDPRSGRALPEEFWREFGPDFFQPRGNRGGQPDAPRTRSGERPKLGINIEAPSDSLRRQFNIPADAKGAVVTNVNPGSLANRFGMKAGDIIKEVNNVKISGPEELSREMAKVRVGDDLQIRFTSYSANGSMDRSVTIPFEEAKGLSGAGVLSGPASFCLLLG